MADMSGKKKTINMLLKMKAVIHSNSVKIEGTWSLCVFPFTRPELLQNFVIFASSQVCAIFCEFLILSPSIMSTEKYLSLQKQ